MSSLKIVLTKTAASHGVGYTPAEKKFFAAAATCVLAMADVVVSKPVTDAVATEAVNAAVAKCSEAGQKEVGPASIIAAAYRETARSHQTVDGDESIGTDEFPKLRDPTSIRLLTRSALEEIGAEKALIDVVAPKYGKAG